MAKKKRALRVDEPIFHKDHRMVTRRDFLRHGLITGSGVVTAGGVFSLFTNPREAYAAVSGDLSQLADSFTNTTCQIGGLTGDTKVPFIAFDLGGGAGISSNVIVGNSGGQLDTLSTAGYVKMGYAGDQLPDTNGANTDSSMNLLFHADSGFLRGIQTRASTTFLANVTNAGAPDSVDGAVIPARSANDTGNNPHNPMYGIATAGGQGGVVTLIGSVSSDSGARSTIPVTPGMSLNPEIRPTKVDRPSDVTGMVDVGNLTAILDRDDVVATMEAMARVSHKKMKLGTIQTGVTRDDVIKELVSCGYLRAADIAERFAGVPVDPAGDPDIVGAGGIFNAGEFGNREYQKTASVMKMVIDGHAGAGTITMGGYDYHTGERGTGERRDFLAGECMGACLEYAARKGTPLMLYVYSDGSVASNGRIDTTPEGRDKPEWTGDNSSTACAFFLVYNPVGPVPPSANGLPIERHRQLGWFDDGGSVVRSSSSMANNVTTLATSIVLNFMSINGDVSPGNFGAFTAPNKFPQHGISDLNATAAFGAII
jgi:hypothetical protein